MGCRLPGVMLGVALRSAAADDDDGTDADLPATADPGSPPRAPDLSVFAAQSRGQSAEPGLARGYHLHPDASGFLYLVAVMDWSTRRAQLAFVEHHGCGVLCRCVGGSAGAGLAGAA